MLNLTAFILGIVAIIGLSKYNHSNKLFWVFFTSMLLGFAGGSITSHLTNNKIKKQVTTYVTSMQTSTTLPTSSPALSIDTRALFEASMKLPRIAKSVSLRSIDRDIVLVDRTLLAFNPETDIGIYQPVNTS